MPADDQDYTGPERRRDLSTQADELSANVNTLNASVVELTRYGRRNRFLIRWNIAGLALQLILLIAVALIAIQSSNASEDAKEATSASAQNRQNARATCESGNEARALQVQLWNYVLDLSSNRPNMTVGQRQQIAQFRLYLARTFAPRDCSNPTPTVMPPTSTPTR
jgi:hypothetical protein